MGVGFRGAREFFAVFFEPVINFFYIVGDGEREFLTGRRVGYEDDHQVAGLVADADDEVAKGAEAGCRIVAGDVVFEHVFVGLAADGLARGVGNAAAVVMDDGVALFAVEADRQIAGGGGSGRGCVKGSGRGDGRGGVRCNGSGRRIIGR